MRTNQFFITLLQRTTDAWPPAAPAICGDAVFHLDAALPTSTSVQYGYNTISGTDIIRMCNIADSSGNTDATESYIGSETVKLRGTKNTLEVYLVVPTTPIGTYASGFSSTLTYNTSATYSTYFIVSKYGPTSLASCGNIITSYNSTTCNWIQERPESIGQSNTTTNITTMTFDKDADTRYITTLRGSTTVGGNTTIKTNGSSWNTSANKMNNSGITYTELLWAYIDNYSKGRTMAFSELIYFDYKLDESDFNTVESYLKNKWKISY